MNKQNSKKGPEQPADTQLKKHRYNPLKPSTQYSNTRKSGQTGVPLPKTNTTSREQPITTTITINSNNNMVTTVAGNHNTTNILEKKTQNNIIQTADVNM